MATTKKLMNSIRRSGSSVYETEQFKEVILLHIPLIEKRQANSSIEITQDEADKWQGDFHGLLRSKGVASHLHWFITVFNGLTDSGAYNANFLEIKTPDVEYIDRLVDIHNTIHL